MKRILSLALICALSSALFAQTLTKENRHVSSFTGLDASGAFTIELTKGSQPSVVVEAEAKYMEYIKTEVRSGVLKLYFQNSGRVRMNVKTPLRAYITVSELTSLELSGACSLTTSDLFTPSRFLLDMSGASKVSGLKLQSNEAKMEASGASKFNISGNIKQLWVSVSGASDGKCNVTSDVVNVIASGASDLSMQGEANRAKIDLSGASSFLGDSFVVKELDFSASGASEASKIQVTDALSIRMSGASKLNYKGTPRLLESKLGGGSTVNNK